jgi:hypothetical protein
MKRAFEADVEHVPANDPPFIRLVYARTDAVRGLARSFHNSAFYNAVNHTLTAPLTAPLEQCEKSVRDAWARVQTGRGFHKHKTSAFSALIRALGEHNVAIARYEAECMPHTIHHDLARLPAEQELTCTQTSVQTSVRPDTAELKRHCFKETDMLLDKYGGEGFKTVRSVTADETQHGLTAILYDKAEAEARTFGWGR